MIPSRALLLALLAVLLPRAASAVPGSEAGALTDGLTGAATAVTVSAEGRYVAAAERSGGGFALWDVRAFSDGAQVPSVCSGASAAVFATGSVDGDRVFVGCDEGEVRVVDLDTSVTPPELTVSDAITVNAGLGDVVFLVYAPGDSSVFAVVQDGTIASLHRLSADAAGGSEGTALGLVLPFTVKAAALSESGTTLLLARSDGYVSRHVRSGESFGTGSSFPTFPLGTISGLAISSYLDLILVADTTNDEVWSFPGAGGTIGLSWGGGFPGASAIAFGEPTSSPVAYVTTDGQAMYAIDTADQAELQDYDLGGATPAMIAPVRETDGDVYVASSDGSIRVITDRPFLTVAASPTSVGEGEPFTLYVTSTEAGDYEVEVGGDGTAGAGTSVATGEVEADVQVELSLSADDLPDEGANRIFIFASGTVGARVDSVAVTLDTPPEAVSTPVVGPGDTRLSVTWTATSEGDIDLYEVFLSDSEFDADSLPSFDVTTDEATESYPLEVAAGEASEQQSHQISGLTNGETYWVAVRAIDEGGQIGPLSGVVSGSPAATCGAAECANDPGCSCGASLVDARSSGLLALLLIAVVASGRRRRSGG
jgi:MYXO-CTERM domain-containing protein